MAITDPVSDMLTRIRNALHALHEDVRFPRSNMRESITSILKDEGYINDFQVDGEDIVINLKYMDGKPVIAGLKKVSKPGRRVYVKSDAIPSVQNGLGICIVSTSRGVLEGMSATEKKVGGELLCEIW